MGVVVALIGLGSNLDHPRRQIARAAERIARIPATRLLALSPNYRSAPVGCATPQPDYVNAVAAVRTGLAPRALLRELLAIERRQRRRRTGLPRNAPRTIDLDLLLYGRRRIRHVELVVPHPRMHERAFVLRPLLDVAPAARLPGRGNARALLRHVAFQRIEPTRRHHR